MYIITINHRNIGPTDYKVFQEEEAQRKGIEFVHWKKAKQGQYAVSDDGYVARVIKRKEYKDKVSKRTNTYIKFPWGYHFFNPSSNGKPLKAEGRKSAYTLSGKPYMEVAAGQEKMKNLAMIYAKVLNSDLAIEYAFGVISDRQKRRWKRMIRTEVFSNMVKEEISDLLGKHDLTEDFTIELLKYSIDKAKAKGDVTNLLKCVDNLQEMHGMKDKNVVKTTQRLEATSTKKLVDDIFEEEKLLAEKTEVKDVDKED